MNAYYPAFLDLRGRACLVVGGGEVGLRKVEALVAAGGRVTLVSPAARPELAAMAEQGAIAWQQRGFQEGDVAAPFLVIAATGDAGVNRAVFAAAERLGRLCNVVDVPELCNFILPAIVRRGEVTVAVSTAGASPTLAQRIRDRVAAIVGEAEGQLAALLRELRADVHARFPDEAARRAAWRRAVDSEALELLRQGRAVEARAAAWRAAIEGAEGEASCRSS